MDCAAVYRHTLMYSPKLQVLRSIVVPEHRTACLGMLAAVRTSRLGFVDAELAPTQER